MAQTTSPAKPSQDANDHVAAFQSKVNLVLVPVVVRDAQGRPVGNLTRDDFQLFDKGKRQTIVSFSAVKRATGAPEDKPTTTTTRAADAESPGLPAAKNTPERFLIYLFDDLNTTFAGMANVRAAAVRHFKSALPPTDRAAIYTFSGRPNLEFTADREQLEDTASKLRWRPAFGHGGMQCPDINYYLADLILNKGDSQALEGLVQHTAACAHVRPEMARAIAMSAANRELIIGAQDTRVALRTIERAIRRLAVMPGQRLIVLASPGFFAQTPEGIRDTAEVLNLAAKANVIVSGLGARGVYIAEEAGDVTGRSAPSKLWVQQRYFSAHANSDVMAELAEGTGGTFFRNNNDLTAGFERVSTAPEFSYVLGFSPAELKTDGRFHSLKVRLPNGKGVSVEARHGYYALKPDAAEQAARSEVDAAVFSRDESSDIPVVLQTGYSKSNAPNAGDPKVLVVAKVDVRSLHFQKADERNRDTLTVVLALFDPDGGYVMGATKTVNLRLRDETLAQTDSEVTLRSEFEVKPGKYAVRVVVREAEGKAMTTLNRTVTVP